MTHSSNLITFLIVLISVSNNTVFGHRRHPHHTTTTTTPRPRFPHLDRILNRLDEERYRTTVAPTVQWHNEGLDPSGWHKLQQAAWKHPELHEFLAADSTHGMLRDDWMLDEEDDSEEDDTRDFGKQRDEATAGGSAITRFKWQSLGTRQDVARTRTRQMASEKEFQAALQHAVRVLETGQCQQPRPRVVCVSDVYPHPSKTYIPRCTLLHQCGDDTGCCKYESETCVVKSSHEVQLPFFTSTVGSKPRNPGTGGASVERLLFYNHTECECQDREQRDNAGRHQAAAAASMSAIPDPRHYMRLPKPRRSPEEDKGCKCPTEYSVRQLDNGTCVCDCFDRQRECLRFKKGKHSFSLADRNCVLNRECREPACEFGAYIARAGRCPIKWEQYGMSSFQEPISPPEPVHKIVSEHKPPEPHHSKPTFDVKPAPWSETKPWTSESHHKASVPSWVSSSDARPSSSHFPSWQNPSPPIASASQTKTWPDTSRSIPGAVQPKPSWSSGSSSDTRPSWSASNAEHKFPWLDSKPTEHKYPWLESRNTDHGKTSQQRQVPSAEHKFPWLATRTTEQRSSTFGRSWGSTTESQPRFPWNPSDPSRAKAASWPPSRSSRDTRARGV